MPSSPKPTARPAHAPAPASQPRERKRVRTGPEVRERRRRILRYALVVVSGLLMVNAMFGDKGYLATIQARQEQERVASGLQALRAENAALSEEVDRLKNDPQALEEAAREGLGLIRPGETLINLRDRKRD